MRQTITANQWAEISISSAIVQNISKDPIYIVVSSETQTDGQLDGIKLNPYSKQTFHVETDEKIYATCGYNSETEVVEVVPVFGYDGTTERPLKVNSDGETVSGMPEGGEGSTLTNEWVILPKGISSVSIMVDAQDSAEANVEYTLDRAGAIAGTTTAVMDWDEGLATNEVKSGSLEKVVAIRMKDIIQNGGGTLPKLFYKAG